MQKLRNLCVLSLVLFYSTCYHRYIPNVLSLRTFLSVEQWTNYRAYAEILYRLQSPQSLYVFLVGFYVELWHFSHIKTKIVMTIKHTTSPPNNTNNNHHNSTSDLQQDLQEQLDVCEFHQDDL